MLPIHFFTIVKNGMPFITWHYPELRKLSIPWTWHIVEGTAAPVGCTSWCRHIEPGLSDDGTTGYIRGIQQLDYRIQHETNAWWRGKVEMVNRALAQVFEPCILIQLDADEIWRAEQIEAIHKMLSEGEANCAYFYCRYFVGPRLVVTDVGLYGNRTDIEWLRAWRVEGLPSFKTHEPPVLDRFTPKPILHKETVKQGLVFDHYAYATEEQVRFKESYYGYEGAVEQWRELQKQRSTVRLRDFLPWVKDESRAHYV